MPRPCKESSLCVTSGFLFLGHRLISANNRGIHALDNSSYFPKHAPVKENSARRIAIALLAAACLSLVAGCKRSRQPARSATTTETVVPPAEVSAEQFHQWRNARRGTRIAEDMSNPYWSWLIESGTSSWRANEHFGGPSSFEAGAAWSPDSFGQSRTTLPDGRELLIAGEHEDF